MDNIDAVLLRKALADRVERARIERMFLRSLDPSVLWTDYVVSSRSPLASSRKKHEHRSGRATKTQPPADAIRDYRVALRGWEPGESYCSCPDFRINTLGTCKHILFALARVRRRFPPSVRAVAYVPDRIVVSLRYGRELELRLLVPPGLSSAALRGLRPFLSVPIPDAEVPSLLCALTSIAGIVLSAPSPSSAPTLGIAASQRAASLPAAQLAALLSHQSTPASLGVSLSPARTAPFVPTLHSSRPSRASRAVDSALANPDLRDPARIPRIHPDAAEHLRSVLYRRGIKGLVAEIRHDPAGHPLRRGLLKRELLPYQLDGIAFSVGVGRAVLADDMGLGKTIQGIGMAELLARWAGISRVLVVCPASLKSHWQAEIAAASGRSCRLVWGSIAERVAQYADGAFFTVCNYEQILHDMRHIERTAWDLIILDEGQRIKNWKARTSRTVKALRSPFALVLSGTPLENRLEELYSVVQFVDGRHLGPMFRFVDRHRDEDADGKIRGYKNLEELRVRLRPILLRRTRAGVRIELPPRTTEIRRVPPSKTQLAIETEQRQTIGRILAKKFLTEDDLLRIQRCLLLCRLAADSAFLVEKIPPARSSKLDEIGDLLDALLSANGRKIVMFSEWTSMLDLVEPILRRLKADFVRLDGSVPQKKRQALIGGFVQDPRRRIFLSTNAGSVGLNLQAADTVVNIDLPWNPAVLEQRISRVHRMGQKKPVQAYLLVTEGMIEESMLATLQIKRDLAAAALDPESGVDVVRLGGGIEALKTRVRTLLDWKSAAVCGRGTGDGAAGGEQRDVEKGDRGEAERLGSEDRGGATRGGTGPEGEASSTGRSERTAADGEKAGWRIDHGSPLLNGSPVLPNAPVQAAGRLMGAMFEFMRALDPGLSVPDEAALNDLSSALARAFQKGVRS